MNIIDRNFKEIFSAQIFSIIGGLFAGVVLAFYTDKIFFIPGMLVILPGFMAMRGNISGTFASRISSGLFLKIIKSENPDHKIIKGNLKGSFILGLMVSLILGLIAFFFNYILSGNLMFLIILIPLLAGFLSNLILTPLTLFTTIYLFKKGHDPNNIIGPFITTTGDITSIISLLFVIIILV